MMQNNNFTITTTRFNNETLTQNVNWKISNNFNGAIYNTPIKLSPKTSKSAPIIVIDMNNDTNKIVGFGLIKNKLDYKHYRIYNTNNYNRFTYKSNYYLSVDEINNDFCEIIQLIESIIFTGKSHLKRGQGISSFPVKFLYKPNLMEKLNEKKFTNLSSFFRQVFLEKFKEIRI